MFGWLFGKRKVTSEEVCDHEYESTKLYSDRRTDYLNGYDQVTAYINSICTKCGDTNKEVVLDKSFPVYTSDGTSRRNEFIKKISMMGFDNEDNYILSKFKKGADIT